MLGMQGKYMGQLGSEATWGLRSRQNWGIASGHLMLFPSLPPSTCWSLHHLEASNTWLSTKLVSFLHLNTDAGGLWEVLIECCCPCMLLKTPAVGIFKQHLGPCQGVDSKASGQGGDGGRQSLLVSLSHATRIGSSFALVGI